MRVLTLFLALAWLPVLASPAVASNQDVRFLFHLVEVQGEGDACAQRPTDVPCTGAVTHGELETPYYAYLMVARGDTALGISEMIFGILYDPVVEIQDWTLCTSGLDFPGPNWPGPCSGNILTWLVPADCQRSTVPGYESQGVLAIAGVFRLVAHDAGELRIAYHPTLLSGPALEVWDCTGQSVQFSPYGTVQMGAAGFGDYRYGVNPCLGWVEDYGTAYCTPTPVLPVTWGRIKSLYR